MELTLAILTSVLSFGRLGDISTGSNGAVHGLYPAVQSTNVHGR